MNKPYKSIVIIAGEESGDFHAANFVNELISNGNQYKFSGIGGHHMQEAGVELISDLAKYGVTGLTEVISHFKVIRDAFKKIKEHLEKVKPDLLILVDYPGFNLRLAKFAKEELKLQILYYISPQIWAWKPNRIKTIQKYIDIMAVILPFEKNIYVNANVNVKFVGHPLVSTINPHQNISSLKNELKLPQDKYLIGILPGSRINEINRLMPVVIATCKRLLQNFPNLHFVLPIAKSIDKSLIESHLGEMATNFNLISGNAIDVMQCCNVVIVSSGTASLECALLQKPMCIIYKASLLTYLAASKLILVKFLGLCNLLENKMIVPELLQYDCNIDELYKVVSDLISDKEMVTKMMLRLENMKKSLSSQQADLSISKLIKQVLA